MLWTTTDAWVSCPGDLHFRGSEEEGIVGVLLIGLWGGRLGGEARCTLDPLELDTQIGLKVTIFTLGEISHSHGWNYKMGTFRSYFAHSGSHKAPIVYSPYLEKISEVRNGWQASYFIITAPYINSHLCDLNISGHSRNSIIKGWFTEWLPAQCLKTQLHN